LELEERIGNVSVGLSPETVVEKLHITKWQAPAGDASEKEIKCVVCQLEYEDSEDVRILPCKHCYHADCIKSWLATKNECPVCKAKAVP
jgi:protein-arginine kinase activator protein McsA